MLKRGEVDIAYLLAAPLAEELKRTPGLTLAHAIHRRPRTGSIFPDQWDPKSPWARPARAPGRQPRHRPPGDQPGGDARLLSITGSIIPRASSSLAAIARLRLRPGQGQAAPGRGRLSRTASTPATTAATPRTSRWRGGGQLPRRGRHPREAPAAGAGGVLQGRTRRRSSRTSSTGQRRLRQRRHPPRGVRGRGRHLRLRRLSRHRRALPGAGRRARPQAARGDAAPDPADAERPAAAVSRRPRRQPVAARRAQALRQDQDAGRANRGSASGRRGCSRREVVALQEAAGLQGITDGELRRQSWHMDFLLGLGGWSSEGQTVPVTFHGPKGDVNFTRPDLAITSRITRPRPIFVEAFKFLASAVSRTPKLTVPSPVHALLAGRPRQHRPQGPIRISTPSSRTRRPPTGPR